MEEEYWIVGLQVPVKSVSDISSVGCVVLCESMPAWTARVTH
jgi:hypothetical protein